MRGALAAWMIALALPAFAQTGGQPEAVAEPEGFRSEPYRAPVPATLTGAQVIDTARALELHRQGVPFLDVLPRKKRPDKLPPGTLWIEEAHYTIPGAVWLYDTGYDRLADAESQRLADGLQDATGGDKAAPVVIFCKADCWMSWNAAKRAVQMGYSAINWFPQGVDGWAEQGQELILAQPVPAP